MSQSSASAAQVASEPGERLRSLISHLALGLTALVLLGTYLLISPPQQGGYEGVIAWRDGSLLKPVVDAMSLGGRFPTARGAEIKDLVLYAGAGAGLALLALRFWVAARWPSPRFVQGGAALLAQICLLAWVGVSLASSLWAISPPAARGQAAIFGLTLAWALVPAWCLLGRDVARVLWVYLFVAGLGILLCGWYFHERNPAHRPGFPIGNPAALASCTVPALLISASLLIGSIVSGVAGEGWRWRRILLGAPLLGIFGWGLQLTSSRGAIVGLAAGALGLAYLRGNRAVRVGLLIALLAAGGAGAWLWSAQKTDLLGARSETLRFRVYAWRYAAMLWGQQPFGGYGAGSYPALAGALSVQDRLLDPAAFYGELVEHAHNELFEVFAEIGLVGGITFVAALLATISAAAAMLRANVSSSRRWLHYGLVAGVVGALVDALFGVGFRLPGMPAVFFTLLGVLWAACRALAPRAPGARRPRLAHPRAQLALAVAAGLAAPLAGALAARNWLGALAEHDAGAASSRGDVEAAVQLSRVAQRELLDPVRQIAVREQEVSYAVQMARDALREYIALRDAPAAAESLALDAARGKAIRTGEAAWRAAAELQARAPALARLHRFRAYAAGILTEAWARRDRQQATQWWNEAWLAWATLHQQRPADVQAVVALTRFPLGVRDGVALLRDGLRAGFPRGEWLEALQSMRSAAGFDEAVAALVAAVGSRDADTFVDDLILSGAPEMLRLNAILRSAAGDDDEAAAGAARAAAMYQKMRSRYPELYAVALAEQAEYQFRARPGDPQPREILRRAIESLPDIQADKRRVLARPFELRAARYALAAGDEEAALLALREAGADGEAPELLRADVLADLAETWLAREPADLSRAQRWLDQARAARPDHPKAWLLAARLAARDGPARLEEALQAAARAGVPAPLIERWRASLTAPPSSQPASSPEPPGDGAAPARSDRERAGNGSV